MGEERVFYLVDEIGRRAGTEPRVVEVLVTTVPPTMMIPWRFHEIKRSLGRLLGYLPPSGPSAIVVFSVVKAANNHHCWPYLAQAAR